MFQNVLQFLIGCNPGLLFINSLRLPYLEDARNNP